MLAGERHGTQTTAVKRCTQFAALVWSVAESYIAAGADDGRFNG